MTDRQLAILIEELLVKLVRYEDQLYKDVKECIAPATLGDLPSSEHFGQIIEDLNNFYHGLMDRNSPFYDHWRIDTLRH